MSFPSYKKITLNSHQKRLIFSQLDQLDFGFYPYIFEIIQLKDQQTEALENIENYFTEHQLNKYSYPIVIITDIPNKQSQFFLTPDKKIVPQFFRMKHRQLSTKESQKLKLVELKQTHLNNLQIEEFEPILNQYAKAHKKISRLNREKIFYEKLARKLHIL